MEKVKNIYYKALKLINDLKLTDKIDIAVCFAKENKNAFYFAIETKDLKHYCFALQKWYQLLGSKMVALFLKDYSELEKVILFFIETFSTKH